MVVYYPLLHITSNGVRFTGWIHRSCGRCVGLFVVFTGLVSSSIKCTAVGGVVL